MEVDVGSLAADKVRSGQVRFADWRAAVGWCLRVPPGRRYLAVPAGFLLLGTPLAGTAARISAGWLDLCIVMPGESVKKGKVSTDGQPFCVYLGTEVYVV